MEQQTKTVIFQLYTVYPAHWQCQTETISWNNKSDHCDRKTKPLALPYREPHQRTPGCCLNSCKWLTLAFVCAVQLVILWTYSHDSLRNCACALQMFALHLQISHGYDYVFNRLCQKQVEAWFYVFNAGCGIFCQPWCHLYDIFCG